MKFQQGQKVICIVKKNEWDHVINNFDEMLKIALGVKPVPKENDICKVINPFQLHYKGKTYISIEGYDNIFAENGFIEVGEQLEHNEHQIEKIKFFKIQNLTKHENRN